MTHLTQRLGQLAGRLERPPQRRHQITTCVGLHQVIQIQQQIRVRVDQPRPTTTRAACPQPSGPLAAEDPESVVAALTAYQNPDGGFGHGLEPDKRAPGSQPLDVEIAFEYLAAVRATASHVVNSACDWLASVAEPSGAVPVLLPSISGYPRAAHWEPTVYPAELNPTAAIAAHGHTLGVSHPWIDRATEYCFAELEADRVPSEAHSLLTMTKLVEVAPNRRRADAAAESIAAAVPEASYMKLDPESSEYGVTPLQFAPTPTALARAWFADDMIESHLSDLEHAQQPDGGWPISWQPPSEATRWEWRGIRTLSAARTLTAYGRLRG